MLKPDVIVIGAGLSGLACALTLHDRGLARLNYIGADSHRMGLARVPGLTSPAPAGF